MVSSVKNTFSVHVHAGFQSVAETWRHLERVGSSTAFQKSSWYELWEKHVAPRIGTVCIVEVRETTSGATVLILPFVVARHGAQRVLSFADGGICDYNAPLVGPDFSPNAETMAEIWQAVRAALPPVDLIKLEKMPPWIGQRANPMLKLASVQDCSACSCGVALSADFERWKEETLPRKFREDMVAKTRKMAKQAQVEFRPVANEQEADRVFAALREQRRERFAVTGYREILDDDHYRDFYRQCVAPGRGGNGVLFALHAGDEIVAAGLSVVDENALYMLMISHKSERWRNYSPGMQLFLNAIRWAIEHKLPYFDLTTGAEGYKSNFGAAPVQLYGLVEGLTLPGKVAAAKSRAKRLARNTVRRLEKRGLLIRPGLRPPAPAARS